jgi:phospholipid/cholesterol/gamma-HCH transport system substrate-binding protein
MFESKKQLKWSKLRVGLAITLALLVLLGTAFFAGNIKELFSPKVKLKVGFRDVSGLRKGAPVWLFGTEIGSVREIHLSPVYGAVVTISVYKSALKFLKMDAHANIQTMGLLGDKYLELYPGSPSAEPIRPEVMIKGEGPVELSNIMMTAGVTIQKMNEFINKLDLLATQIETGKGTISKFFTDPAIYNNLKNATQSLSSALEDLKRSQGTLKLLVEDPSLYNRMLSATSSLEAFSQKLNESPGTLKMLIEDPSLYNKTLDTLTRLEEFSKKITEGHGTLGKFVENPELYDNLNRDLKALSFILERMERGEGIAGALISDQELARELKETVQELKGLIKDMKDHPRKFFKFSLF